MKTKTAKDIAKYMQTGTRPYVLLAALVSLAYFFFMPVTFMQGRETAVGIVMRVCLIGVFACLLIGYYYKIVKFKHIILAILICGFIMRIGYMAYTIFYVRGHDIGRVDQDGHYAYIYNLYANFSLPETNDYQFYHPPLMHILSAAVAHVVNFFRQTENVDLIIDASKIVSCFASCGILLVSYKICNLIKLPKIAIATALGIIAFHPTFYILAASVNNDVLMIFLFMCSILYTIKWYYNPTFKNIIILAFAIGLSMMTKMSGGIVAIFTAPIFLIVLMNTIRRHRDNKKGVQQLTPNKNDCGFVKLKSIFLQFFTFGAISFPLGLWYPVRNFIKFDQAFNYVPKMSEQSTLYCGDYSVFERFLSFPFDKLFDPVYCQPRGDYNLWLYTVKCSAFGEFTFQKNEFLAKFLIATTFLIILISLFAVVYVFFKCKNSNTFARFGLPFIWFIQIIVFVEFNFQFPHGCTMDTRYIVPAIICGAILIGVAIGELVKSKRLISKIIVYFIFFSILLFSISSILFYTSPMIQG